MPYNNQFYSFLPQEPPRGRSIHQPKHEDFHSMRRRSREKASITPGKVKNWQTRHRQGTGVNCNVVSQILVLFNPLTAKWVMFGIVEWSVQHRPCSIPPLLNTIPRNNHVQVYVVYLVFPLTIFWYGNQLWITVYYLAVTKREGVYPFSLYTNYNMNAPIRRTRRTSFYTWDAPFKCIELVLTFCLTYSWRI